MDPVFTSHYSLGKSILTLEGPSEFSDGPDSIFSIAKENNLKDVYLVDENCAGVFEAVKNAKNLGCQLKFGLKVNVITDEQKHKVVIFAKNAKGIYELFEIYSNSCDGDETGLDQEDFNNIDFTNLALVIPFYDSYLYRNMFEFGTIVPKFPVEPIYMVESNGLPYDGFLERKIKKVSSKTWDCKTIFYKDKEDFESWQVYKIACAREAGKKRTLDVPNLQWCGSNQFCWESFKEKTNVGNS